MAGYPGLYQRGGMWWYRKMVPDNLRAALGKREIKLSLRTRDRAEATSRYPEALRNAQELLAAATRGDIAPLRDREQEQIAVAWWLHQRGRLGNYHPNGDPTKWAMANDGELTASLSQFLAAERPDIRVGSHSFDQLMRRCVIEHHAETGGYANQIAERWKAIQAIERALHNQAVAPQQIASGLPGAPTGPRPIHSHSTADPCGVTLSRLFDMYRAASAAEPKSLAEFDRAVRWFVAFIGNLDVAQITKLHIHEFMQLYRQMPKTHSKELRQLSPQDAIKRVAAIEATGRPQIKRVSPTTVEKHRAALAAVLSWAAQHDIIASNPAAGLRPDELRRQKKRGAPKPRISFSRDDLRKVFSSPIYTGCASMRRRAKPGPLIPRDTAFFWLPLLALFTGARLEELGQLRASDIECTSGADLIRFAGGEDGALKTRASYRQVPVHVELRKIGFLARVEQLRRSGSSMLFPELKANRNGDRTQKFSTRWGTYLDEIGLDDPRLTFHSFRHTFKDACRRANLNERVEDALMGHTRGSVEQQYGSEGYPISVLAEAMAHIAYPELDLPHLYLTSASHQDVSSGAVSGLTSNFADWPK